ncbi:MAG: methionyl-tRNA formyltransferase [Betaproteobacteria bacterium]|nr:methionyl-tRNA formyltransferase [Betaproteobacteria bacterium]
MKLVFAGTPAFAAAALTALHQAGHAIAMVLTQPDRPAGRGMKLVSSAVAQVAERLALRLEKPQTLKDENVQAMLREVGADIMVVAAYGLLLPQAVLDMPRLGCLNIHGSLLPRWRGAAPVQRAIEAGDAETGIAIMQMDAGLDTGAVLLERKIAIAPDETSASLFEKLVPLGASAIVEALKTLPKLVPRPQPPDGATYAKKIEKAEARIDWNQTASSIERRIRAFDPFPGCETLLGEEHIKIWRAEVVDGNTTGAIARIPATIVHVDRQSLIVQCGQQQLRWVTVQKPGSKRMPVGEFLRGTAVAAGTQLS